MSDEYRTISYPIEQVLGSAYSLTPRSTTMTTINDLDQINTMAMMTLCELGYSRYERFLSTLSLDDDAGDKLRKFVHDWVDREHELELRIRVAPMHKTMQ